MTDSTTVDFSNREPSDVAINTIRCLSIDMVEAANSGHPGAPMGQAAMAFTLWSKYLRHDPKQPTWPNRDRFVLSSGHASALIYSLLHLSGYDLPLEELRRFRQMDSQTPGHPEYGHTVGVETTTGPLGQGFGNAVGMAIAESMLAAHFNRPDHTIFDYRTWAIAGDGDLMEGVCAEAASAAGHLRLGKLNVVYDSNSITIEGSTDLAFTEDTGLRFESMGWHVVHVQDGNDLEELSAAMEAAIAETSRPSLLVVTTHIGFGSPNKQDSEKSHGSPLGENEVRLTKEALDWPLDPTFLVPAAATEAFAAARLQGARGSADWSSLLDSYRSNHPDSARDLDRRLAGEYPEDWENQLATFETGSKIATRAASGKVLNSAASIFPELVGGSADLAGSNQTLLDGEQDYSPATPSGRNMRFGVREHAMGSLMNGMALSGMLRPYGGTFLIFSDYMRPAMRLSALMGQPVVYVLTHDSIFLGEDGPTHQPVSQLLSLRSIPGLTVMRPCDGNETREAWRLALSSSSGPTALCLTRQKLEVLKETSERAQQGVSRGGYILASTSEAPELLLIATGSEVHLALDAYRKLIEEGVAARVVSLPSWELFDAQSADYRDSVLPPSCTARLAIEAGLPLGWERYVGLAGAVVGQEGYGASAPADELAVKFGFTIENVLNRANQLLGR